MPALDRLAPALPVANRVALVRPRLLDRLAERFRARVVVVAAPAGYGKTTLLAQAVRENALAPQGLDLWLSCRPESALLSVLGGALHAAVGLAGPVAAGPDEVARQVADALWAAAPEHVALVLDDVHALERDSPGAALLGALVARLPGNGHLVLGSRPPLPVAVARLIASGEAVLLTEHDLAFSSPELAAFADLRQVPVGRLADTGSWPALAELQATTGLDAVSSYLWEELLARLTPARRRSLAALVVAGGADEELAAAVAGCTDLPALLDGLPLVTSSDDGWWTLHPLWEGALRAELTDAEVAGVRRTAAGVLRARGRWHEAMTQLLRAEAWDDVRELVRAACGSFSPLVSTDVLEEWQRRLPAVLQDEPEGLLLAGVVRAQDEPREAVRLLELAYTRSDGRGDVALASVESLVMIAFWRSDTGGLPDLHARMERLAAQGYADAAAFLHCTRALLARDAAGVEQELALIPLDASGRVAPLVEWLRAHLSLLHLGDPETARSLAAAALPRVPPTLRAAVRCELVESLRLLGRLDDVDEQAGALVEDLAQSVVRTPRHVLAAVVARCLRGEPDDALLGTLRAMVGSTPIRWAPWAAALGEAHVLLARGREAAAAEVLEPVAGQSPSRCRSWLRINPSALPLLYVLVPATREHWHALPLAGCFPGTRAAAAALVAQRAGSLTEVRELELPDWEALVGPLPLRWAVELAVGRTAAGLPDGRRLLRRLDQAARPALRVLAAEATPKVAATARLLLAGLPALPRQSVELRVLGPLRLLLDGREVTDPDLRRERVRVLLGRLLLAGSLPRTRLAEQMWPDLDEAAAARNLRVTLNYLQRLLEPLRDEHDSPWFVRSTGPVLQLVTGTALTVDAWRFADLLDAAARAERQSAPSLAISAYREAVALYAGELLADLPDDDWLVGERERLRGRFVAAASRLGQLLLVQGELAEAEELAARVLRADPYSEQAFGLLATVRLQTGDRPGAGRVLRQGRLRLAELGVEPGPAFVRLERQALGVRPAVVQLPRPALR